MVYESDFYTTRRYRTSPSLSTYTVSYQPSRQVRLLPGLGKVHVVHNYDRIVPYVGHKRLTVVSPPPQIFSVRPSVLLREFDRIQYKYRPAVSYSYVNNYLNSNSSVTTVSINFKRRPIPGIDSYSIYRPGKLYIHQTIRSPLRHYYNQIGFQRLWYDARMYYVRRPIPGLDSYTICRPGRLYLHSVVSRPSRLSFDQLGHRRHWYDAGVYYVRNPLTDYRYTYTPTSVYYHSLIERPQRLYSDILGYPRYSRYWYNYWYDVPSVRYSDYYNTDIANYRYWSSDYRWYNYSSPAWYRYLYPSSSYKYWYPSSYKYWYPSLATSSWYNYLTSPRYSSISSWYPSLSSTLYTSLSPYWSNYWTSADSAYSTTSYWNPSWSRYWRSIWSRYWYRYYNLRLYYDRDPLKELRYINTPTSVYYHSIVGRPLRLYSDILGLPRFSRYWYRYWYDIPSVRYSDYSAYNIDSYRNLPSYWSRWHNYWSPSWYKYLTPSTYKSWYPSLTSTWHSSQSAWYPSIRNWYPEAATSWYNYLSPYWSRSWASSSLPYHWSTYWNPSWHTYWRSQMNRYTYRYYDAIFNDETSRIRADAAGLLKRIHTPVVRTPLSLLPYNTRHECAGDLYELHSHVPLQSKNKVQLLTEFKVSQCKWVWEKPLHPIPIRRFFGRLLLPLVKQTYIAFNETNEILDQYSEPILSSRITSDDYIYKMLNTSPYNAKLQYTTYYSEPTRRYIGPSHLAAVRYSGGKAYGRRPNVYAYEDPVKDDIQLLSYYINKFRSDKAMASRDGATGPLSPARPSRHFSSAKQIEAPPKQEKMDLSVDRASIRLGTVTASQEEVEAKLMRQKEIARAAEEKALAEEAAKKKAQALKEEAVRKAELARQEELAAQAAAERAAELERKAEQLRQEELAKQAELDRIREEEEERERLDEERRATEAAKAEEERQQLLRLEEIAREAKEERERGLARQAEELAELARQEAELEEQARQETEALSQAKKEEELAELAKQEAELEELERQERELAELARQESELAQLAKHEAELAKQEAEIADLATQEAELKELQERQRAELDALEAEAKLLEETYAPEEESTPAEEAVEEEPAAEEEVEEEQPEETEPVVADTEPEPQAEEEPAEEEEEAEEE